MQCTLIVVLQGALQGACIFLWGHDVHANQPLNPNREGISESEAYRDFTF
jgi:hypothetical protein